MMTWRLNWRLQRLSGVTLLTCLLASILAGCGIVRDAPAPAKTPAASPTARADRQALYVGFAGALIAFRASDGNVLWTHINPSHGFIFSPIVSNGVLYTGADNEAGGQLLALRARDGAVIWQTALDRPVWATPTLSSGVLFATAAGSATSRGSLSSSLYALDARTGHILWRFQMAGSASSSMQLARDVIYFDATTHLGDLGGFTTTIYALRQDDGALLWRKAVNGDLLAQAVGQSAVYYSLNGNSLNDMSLAALNAATGAQLWKRAEPDRVSWIGVDGAGSLYIGLENASVSALRTSDGAPLWTSSLAGGFAQSDSPAVSVQDGLMYIGSISGYVAVLDATTGATRWRVCVGNESCDAPADRADWSTPLVAGGTIYFGVTVTHWSPLLESPGAVYALDTTTGAVRWQFQRFGGELGTPALAAL